MFTLADKFLNSTSRIQFAMYGSMGSTVRNTAGISDATNMAATAQRKQRFSHLIYEHFVSCLLFILFRICVPIASFCPPTLTFFWCWISCTYHSNTPSHRRWEFSVLRSFLFASRPVRSFMATPCRRARRATTQKQI